MTATVRIGTCSWADEGLLKAWYPRGVSTAEARLRYYAERFDVVEVDSPYYALPDPAVTERWARRTPDAFTFHVKASAAMTWHEGEPTDEAFACSRGCARAPRALGEAPGRPPPVPPALHEVGSPRRTSSRGRPSASRRSSRSSSSATRSWLEEAERADTLAFLEANGLAFVSLDSPRTRASNVSPRVAAATHRVAYVRFHGRNAATWNIRGARSAAERFDWLYAPEEPRGWVEPIARLAGEAEEVYALFNNNRTTSRRGARADPPRAPRRGGDPRRGRGRASADRARRSSDRR